MIADTPAALTPAWLSDALGAPVADASLTAVGTGQMCDSYRVSLTFAGPTDLPATVIAKQPAADPTSRETGKGLRSYEAEVRFYQQVAATVAIRTPAVYYADIDVESASFVLLLEDMAPARQGDQIAGCSVAEARVALDELVKLHAPRWGDPTLLELDWLTRDPETGRQFMMGMLPVFWAGFTERYADRLDRSVRTAGEQLLGSLESYLQRPPPEGATVVHGDYRLDNLLFGKSADDPLAVVDWQTVAHGSALGDVAYFIGAGLLADDRRAHEEDLVRRYHTALVAAGVGTYPWEQCWDDYRRATYGGLVMAMAASMLVERTERGDDMFMTMAHRHAAHALDLDAASLLR